MIGALSIVIKSTLILAFAFVLDRALRRRHVFACGAMWNAALMGLALAQQSGVVRFLEGKTNAAGRFEFPRIPKDAEVELVWWGSGIASGRSNHLETLDDKERAAIEIDLPAPATIKVTIDRDALPAIGQINILNQNAANEHQQLVPKPDQKSFEVAYLAPGTYIVQVMGPYESVPGSPGQLTSKILAQATVTVGAGETGEVEFNP